MKYIGIDPGKSGALACIDDKSGEVTVIHFEAGYIPFLKKNNKGCFCLMESVHTMPKDGKATMFAFGKYFGYVQGILDAFGIRRYEITPQTWEKEFELLKEDKSAAIAKAKELFPGVNLKKTERCTNESDGMADALLIAEYARRYGEKHLMQKALEKEEQKKKLAKKKRAKAKKKEA